MIDWFTAAWHDLCQFFWMQRLGFICAGVPLLAVVIFLFLVNLAFNGRRKR